MAISSHACGGYNYIGSFRPMGHESRDIGLYQEEDGTAYLLSNDVSLPQVLRRKEKDWARAN